MNEISTLYLYLQIEGLLLEGCSFDGTMITENDRSSASVSNVPECSIAWIANVSVFNFFFFFFFQLRIHAIFIRICRYRCLYFNH